MKKKEREKGNPNPPNPANPSHPNPPSPSLSMAAKMEQRMGRMEGGVDAQLWHACAGGMVNMPAPGSKVYYFPQGHAEHAASVVEFPRGLRVAPLVLCNVVSVSYLADGDTDEVYARIRLQPTQETTCNENLEAPSGVSNDTKAPSFAKTLTQSDANNGGGFSVPRYCAETIFPPLEYSNDPPVQTVYARDVHGELWKFRHIYRGTPRRHLLTTGWSTFVNHKKLVAGDSIVFLRNPAGGELCVGVRRSSRSSSASNSAADWHWQSSATRSIRWSGGGAENLSDFLSRAPPNSAGGTGFARNRGRVGAKSVVEAATLAASGQAFEVVYYPRASTPEFCVKAQAVTAALRTQWVPGMRFKMAFETEDSSRISWFMGTVSSVQYADPLLWPNSPWRLLQVAWDEPDLLQNVKRVSPWLVEVVSNMPTIQMTPFMLPKKKLRVTQPPEFHVEGQGGIMGLQMATLTNNVLGQINSWHSLSNNVPAGMQGARHDSIYGIGFSDIRQNKLQSRLFLDNLHHHDPGATAPVSTDLNIGNFSLEQSKVRNGLSCSLTMGNSSQSEQKGSNYTGSAAPKTTSFLLFGKPIHTVQSPKSQKQQQDGINSPDGLGFPSFKDTGSPGLTSNSSSDGNQEIDRFQGPVNERTDGLKMFNNSSIRPQHGESCGDVSTNLIGTLQSFKDQSAFLSLKKNMGGKLSEDTIVQCKVFSETEEVGRTLDLTLFSTYEQLYDSLAKMFGIEEFKLSNRVLYKDIGNTLRHAGEEPYGDFVKTVRRITIASDSGRDMMSR
ncbi:hypothetical protein SUGI_0062790 [Cryptomeria japonica]|uniref:auxin response factor 10 n=1 Tax=Cryptomeria japonica TaxID=3369 RepID=UPI002408A66C|nr:auxin response factor 10 [Cryptomeria japonica]GLJ07249.1 hypothetical protein SUGI_0062790 [Cryptomeria japonica]